MAKFGSVFWSQMRPNEVLSCTIRRNQPRNLNRNVIPVHFQVYSGIFCRYRSSFGSLNQFDVHSKSCNPTSSSLFCSKLTAVRSRRRTRTPLFASGSDEFSVYSVIASNSCFLTKNSCWDQGNERNNGCPKPCCLYSTKVTGRQKPASNPSSNEESSSAAPTTNFGINAKSRLDQTKQLIKETTDKVKEKMEEISMRENIMTVPNILSLTRIVLSPVLGYLVVQKSFHFALGVFVFAGLTDLLDGFIARHFKNQQSMFGSFLDPLADKFLVFFLVLSLTCSDLLPVSLTVLIIARDVCLLAAGFYIRFLSLPPPRTLSRYFDATHATAQLSPTFVSKCNTLVQLTLVACTLASPVFHVENHPVLQAFWYLTATTTVASGLSYMFSKNTYHLLQQLKEKKR